MPSSHPSPSLPPLAAHARARRKKVWLRVAMMIVAMGLGGWLRLADLEHAGPILWDDAYMQLEARFFASGAAAVAESAARWREERRSGQDLWKLDAEVARVRAATQGQPPFYGRPAHTAATLAAMAVLGDVPFAACVASAVLGWLTIPLAGRLGERLGAGLGERAGAIAGPVTTLALAFAPYHVLYSREGFSEGASLFFVGIALNLYLRSRDRLAAEPLRGTALAGAALGLMILGHARWAILAPLVVALELEGWRAARLPFDRVVARMARLAFFAGLPLLAAELPYYGVLLLDRRLAAPLPVHTYLEQNLYQFALGSGGGLNPGNWPTYPYLFSQVNGFGWCAALVVGLAGCAVWARGAARLLPLLLLAIPGALFSVSRVAHMRYGVVLTFAAALVIGVGVAALLAERSARVRLAAAAVGVLVCGEMLHHALELRSARYAWPAAIAWLREHGSVRHVSTQAFVSEVYTSGTAAAFVPDSVDELERLVLDGHRYLVADVAEAALRYNPKFAARFRVYEEAIRGRTPVASFPNPTGRFLQPKFEMNFDFHGTLDFIRSAHERGDDEIRIYDLTAPRR